ncbi:hypothetical protein TrLO_g1023 [Triparma laevis f. longispina]|uniref:Uncharacterized protein n=1 Tax=Triparma laevis f. longispina TaxID=1714387 RepID=A0A9W7ALS5_9STRA|nr:hypothetical protein TrLO_g1023 [Triparma laevis f. longispina]
MLCSNLEVDGYETGLDYHMIVTSSEVYEPLWTYMLTRGDTQTHSETTPSSSGDFTCTSIDSPFFSKTVRLIILFAGLTLASLSATAAVIGLGRGATRGGRRRQSCTIR